MSELRNRTPSLPMARDAIDAGQVRRPVRSMGQQFRDFLTAKDTVTLALLGSVSAVAVLPQAWLAAIPVTMGYYLWAANQKFRLPFKVPSVWGGVDYGAPLPGGGRGYGKASGILYLGQDQASLEELWIENGDARRHGFFLGTTGSGKALPLVTLVLTPRGWVMNGDLRPGDEVCHPSGDVAKILSIHPQGAIPAVRVWFSDGRFADCSTDHLWHVRARAKNDLAPAEGFDDNGRIMTAGDLGLLHGLRGSDLHLSVPLAAPHKGMESCREASLSPADARLAADKGLAALSYMPSLYGTPEERLAFLRDWAAASGCTVSVEPTVVRLGGLRPEDANPLKQIAWSLGGVATTYLAPKGQAAATVEVVMNFPAIGSVWPQAADCPMPGCGDGLEIIEIEPLEGLTEMSCIKTDREDGLYVMENHVVTHNTELLLGICAQTLMWSSGFMFIDGKGTTEFYARAWTLAKRFGREDDIRVLNFTDAGEDPDAPSGGPGVQSNTLNPFAKGGSDQLMNLIVGLMGDAGQGNDMWKNRAMSLVTAAMKALCLMRDAGDILLDVQAIRDFLPLGTGVNKDFIKGPPPKTVADISEAAWTEMRTRGGMIELYLRALKGDFSNASVLALKGFFDSLPGFSMDKALAGTAQADKASEQYNFLSMQLTKPLGSLADDYGHTFRTPLGEVDIDDIVLNRRILIVLLPALQKAPEEMQNCGKIVVNLVKIMMGNASGSNLQGSRQDIVESKQTRAPSPFICVLDEAGYYMVKGIDVMMAQARSLGFMIIVAGQDMSAMQSISPQIAETAMANASLFAAGKTTDAGKTLEVIQKQFGRAQVSVSSGYQIQAGVLGSRMVSKDDVSFQEVEKVKVEEMQNMMEGEFYFSFNGTLVKAATFYVGTVGKGGFGDGFAVNKFIKVRGPADRVPGLDQKVEEAFMGDLLITVETMIRMANTGKEEEIPLEDGLSGMGRAAENFLWMTGAKASHPANIHGAWLGAMMAITEIEEALPETGDEDDYWEDEITPLDDTGDGYDLLKDESPDIDDLLALPEQEEETAGRRPARPGAGNGRSLDERLREADITGAIGESLMATAQARTQQERHGGLIDLMVAQEARKSNIRQHHEISKLIAQEEARSGFEMAETRRSFGDFFTMLAENSARFAQIFSEENVDGDLGIEILRRTGGVRPLPLSLFSKDNFMEESVSELEKIMSIEAPLEQA